MNDIQQIEAQKHRRYFAIGLAVVGGGIALASFSSTYAINLESFADWSGNLSRGLALCASIGIEVMFCLVIYAISYALVGGQEKFLGVLSLAFLLFVMATNYVIHRQIVKGIRLSEWQQGYYDWAGALALFGVLLIIVLFGAVSYEARERREKREVQTLAARRALEWKKALIHSEAFTASLDAHKPAVLAEMKRQLALPAVAETKPGIGLAPNPKAGDESKN